MIQWGGRADGQGQCPMLGNAVRECSGHCSDHFWFGHTRMALSHLACTHGRAAEEEEEEEEEEGNMQV